MGGILRNPVIRQRYVPKITKHEQNLQLQVCRYLDLQYPNAIYLTDYAAGMKLTRYQAGIRTSMQSCRGLPDLIVLSPQFRDGKQYAGLCLELKRDGTRVYLKNGNMTADEHIREQAAVIKRLNDVGYFARFGIGFENCKKLIDWYFGKPQNGSLF